jgi:hypothetical protein
MIVPQPLTGNLHRNAIISGMVNESKNNYPEKKISGTGRPGLNQKKLV